MKKETKVLLVLGIVLTILAIVLMPITKHTYVYNCESITKDAVKVTIPIKITYIDEMFLLKRKERIENNIRGYSCGITKNLIINFTATELHRMITTGVSDITLDSLGGDRYHTTIFLNDCVFEKAFEDYLNKINWFGEIIMIKKK